MSGPRILGGVAAGIALGTLLGFYVLAPNVEGGPGAPDSSAKQELEDTARQRDEATAGLDADDAVLASLADKAVGGVLKDRSVFVVAAPDVDRGVVDAQRRLLTAAGATDAGTLELSEAAVSQDKADDVKSVAVSTLPAGARLSEDRRDPGYHLGQLIGQAVRTAGGSAKEASTTDRDVVFASLDKGGFLDGGVPQLTSADAVVVLAGGTAGYTGGFIADLTAGLDATTGGAVLAGDAASARDGGAVAVLRSDRGDTEKVSSVDNADRTVGQITVVRAVAAQLTGKAGSYGSAESAVAPTL